MTDIHLLLASSSPYRRSLLKKLRIPFQFAAPDIDETPLPNERPEDYVLRLANDKAQALVQKFPEHWIIGSDQTCLLNGAICGKPLTEANAVAQLMQAQGQTVKFFTGVCLLNAQTGQYWQHCEPFEVDFRSLARPEIEHYVRLEKPLSCAGSFMVEGLGIQLFERLNGRDENSLIGLPLIALIDLMRQAGLSPLELAR